VDLNNPTGSTGLIAIDKRGSHALFFEPSSFALLDSLPLPARPHEVAISADHRLAYVSIYGNGVYGNNTEPGRAIVVIDLEARRQVATLDVSPFRAPHGLQLGPDNLLYASCDQSGVIAVVDPAAERLAGSIEAGSTGPHMIALLPDGSKLYSENEEDPFVSVMDPASRTLVRTVDTPGGSAGISADGRSVLVVHAREPLLTLIDPATDRVAERIPLHSHTQPAQRVRHSPDGRYVVVTSMEEPLVTILDASSLHDQTTLQVADGPMGVGFAPDGRTMLVGNHGAGRITVVDLPAGCIQRDFAAGVGVETLAFY
jgi:DNA-binding beta-propeller fold protein YncE